VTLFALNIFSNIFLENTNYLNLRVYLITYLVTFLLTFLLIYAMAQSPF